MLRSLIGLVALLLALASPALAQFDGPPDGRPHGGNTSQNAGRIAGSPVGYLLAPENTQNVSYTLALTDCGKLLYHTSGSTHTYTIPANAAVPFPIGCIIVISNESGAGALTLAITSDTLEWGSSTGSRTISANGTVSLMKVAAGTWRLTGDGIS